MPIIPKTESIETALQLLVDDYEEANGKYPKAIEISQKAYRQLSLKSISGGKSGILISPNTSLKEKEIRLI